MSDRTGKKRKREVYCWTGYRETLEFGSEEWADSWDKPDKTCLLLDGHKGPHKWTPGSEIMVRFGDDTQDDSTWGHKYA